MTIRNIPLGRLALFGLLSSLDLVLTRLLILNSEGQVYESNPIANWWLTQAGWLGLTAFKTAAVLLVAGLSLLIARSRPRLGGLVLSFACSAVAGVVLYSTSLAACLESQPDPLDLSSLRAIEADNQLLDGEHESMIVYKALQAHLTDDLRERRCTLAEAVQQLQTTERGQSRRWLKCLRGRYPGLSDEQCLAANLVEFVRLSVEEDPQVGDELAGDFVALYGMPVPFRPDDRRPPLDSHPFTGIPWEWSD